MQIYYITARQNMQNVIKVMEYNKATQKIFMSVLYSTDKSPLSLLQASLHREEASYIPV